MQSDEQVGERLQEPLRPRRPQHATEQRAVRQRETQVPGDQRRIERLTVRGYPVGDDADGLDHRHLAPR